MKANVITPDTTYGSYLWWNMQKQTGSHITDDKVYVS